jgi:Secretion system C-terminal sorting domain
MGAGSTPFALASDGHNGLYALGAFAGLPMVVGSDTIESLGDEDLFFVKLDSAGLVKWVRTAGGNCFSDNERSKSVVVDPSGDRAVITGLHNCGAIYFDTLVVTGSGTITPHDGFIAAYDSAGAVLWATSAEGFDVRPEEVLVDANHSTFWFGGIVTMGAYFNDDDPIVVPPGGFVAKYAEDGDLLYAERWLTHGTIDDADWYSAEEFVLCGSGRADAEVGGATIGLESNYQDGWLARLDTSGAALWSVPFRSDSNSFAYRCAAGPSGDVVVLGGFQGYVVFGGDTIHGSGYAYSNYLVSCNANGALNWAHRLGGDSPSAVFDMERAPDGSIYVLGDFEDELVLPGMAPLGASTALDMFIARFDQATGLCESAYHYGKVGSYYGESYGSLWPTAHGLYVAECYDSTLTMGSNVVEPTGPVATDIFIAKFDSLSGFTGIESMPLQQGGELHIYANPNKGTCTIDLPKQLQLTNDLMLSIFDQTGHLVQRMPLRYTNDGVGIDIRAQAKGIYHVELGDGRQRYTGTIVFE